MKIEHIAIWVKDIEAMKAFYERYFNAFSSNKYTNPKKQFESYFLSFSDGPRLELMHMPSVPDSKDDCYSQSTGLIHFAVSVGSEEKVNALTAELRERGVEVVDGPRRTGDGYYESVVLDPEGNRVEITV